MSRLNRPFYAAFILTFLFSCFSQGWSLEKLPETYLVSYGDPNAPTKITHYFSFTCPHCVALYREEFSDLRTHYVDTGRIFLTFHPVPMDLLTVRAMHCMEKLAPKEKKVFLEAVLEELVINNTEFSSQLMIKAMELFDKPTPLLMEKEYLQETEAFKQAFEFLKQKEKVIAIPTIEVNGKVYPNEVPDKDFLESLLPKVQKGTGGLFMKYSVTVERVLAYEIKVSAKNIDEAEEKVITLVASNAVDLERPDDEDWNIREIEEV